MSCSYNGCFISNSYATPNIWNVIQRNSDTPTTLTADAVDIKIATGDYLNIPKNSNGYGLFSPNTPTVESLFSVDSSSNAAERSTLTLESGVHAIIKGAFDGS